MTRYLPALALAAAALAGCDRSDQTIVQGPYDPQAEMVANAGKVELPPSITASHTYRCKDNSVVYIDWMSDGAARVKASPNERATTIAVGGEDPVLTGAPADKSVTYRGQSCSR